MKKYLTYDDVNIVPKYSEVNSRGDVKLNTRFTRNTELTIPIVASPMDTVTELDMAFEMMERGGVGVIHRFNTIEEQSKMMKSLHRKWDSFFKIGDGREKSADNDYDDWYKKLNGRTPTISDYEDLKDYGIFTDDMAKDDKMWRRKPLCAAVGATGDYLERAEELVKNGCNVILIDVAHGHHSNVGEAIEKIKSKISNVEVIAGNIATGDGARFLCRKGADGIRVGIGNGSLCETRIRTGVGLPQVSVLLDVCSVADEYNVPIIADGGIRNVGDVAKGIGCGADSIMVGSLLSGTKESPGSIEKQGQWPNEKLFKKYRGSASRDSKGNDKNVEGNHKVIPYKGKVNRILSDITDGLRSSCSYVGAIDIDEYHSKVEFVEVTNAGQVEARPHLLN
jgi:IMP dehydrogenase|tara:strand:+ start:856 stop:2037 length:1182 start_codon:yes stop_codon:yes gene_type:complete